MDHAQLTMDLLPQIMDRLKAIEAKLEALGKNVAPVDVTKLVRCPTCLHLSMPDVPPGDAK